MEGGAAGEVREGFWGGGSTTGSSCIGREKELEDSSGVGKDRMVRGVGDGRLA